MSIRGGVYIYLCWFAALYFLVGLFLLAQIRYSALTMEFGHVSSFCLLIVYVKSNYSKKVLSYASSMLMLIPYINEQG